MGTTGALLRIGQAGWDKQVPPPSNTDLIRHSYLANLRQRRTTIGDAVQGAPGITIPNIGGMTLRELIDARRVANEVLSNRAVPDENAVRERLVAVNEVARLLGTAVGERSSDGKSAKNDSQTREPTICTQTASGALATGSASCIMQKCREGSSLWHVRRVHLSLGCKSLQLKSHLSLTPERCA